MKCELCGGMRRVYVVPLLPHGLHWTRSGGENIKIDCTGEEVF